MVREIIKTAVENRQDLIVEGCYIPFDWRQDFDGNYLRSIRFVCLALSEEYIDRHFADIIDHESDIETRYFDTCLTPAVLKRDNRFYIDGFVNAGEPVTVIEKDYNETIKNIISTNIDPAVI